MIKIFRNFRMHLLSDGKTGRYMKYAIGEIVLVVLGILIALQINSWYEQRKAESNERALYGRILTDLKIDEDRINGHINYYKRDQELLSRIHAESRGISTKDPIRDFSTIRAARIFDLIITANYSKLTMDISTQRLLERMDQYFRAEKHVNDAFTYLWDFKEDWLKPYLAKHGINDSKALFDNRKLNYYDLRVEDIFSYQQLKKQYGTVELDQILFDLGIRTAWTITALEDLLVRNKGLQADLMIELNE